MTRLVYRLSRGACPSADRPWLDALFAEMEAIDSGRARLLWLLGAPGLLLNRYTSRLYALLTPAILLCFLAALAFAWMALIEFEGFLPEDDWYGPLAALCVASLIGFAVLNLKHPSGSLRP